MHTSTEVASFVLRCSRVMDTANNQYIWRIMVSHVQKEEVASFKTLEEAYEYMNSILSR
ncbi:hypothetical protein ACWE42_08815 [Sutcliffiella cohnii]|uniref:hypothetical protein n=1 Tax=Sutcliffiella TaxID=2837511 RepID=UPI000AD44054|nr:MULTISPECIES: hypothetical protein [Sutcliffiella]MED4016812.1 hypothetical protein [Sutcliffiella cohnii]WBL16180.1 hypothetical protein O1A01_05995 [Sutcliffiella sp. NC1]